MKAVPKESAEQKHTLTRKAYQDIRRMIFLNEFKPGQKIPYREMASRINMSLTPVVQALKHMEFLGLVRHEPNRGFFVNSLTVEEVSEVYELRELLEIHLIPKIIANLDEDAEVKIQNALAEYLDASQSGSLNLQLAKDMQLHMTLAEISGEVISIKLLRYLLDFLYLRFDPMIIFSRPQKSAANEHQKICNRIMAKDPSGACDAMRNHIQSIRDNVLEGFQKRLEEQTEIDI